MSLIKLIFQFSNTLSIYRPYITFLRRLDVKPLSLTHSYSI